MNESAKYTNYDSPEFEAHRQKREIIGENFDYEVRRQEIIRRNIDCMINVVKHIDYVPNIDSGALVSLKKQLTSNLLLHVKSLAVINSVVVPQFENKVE